MSQSNNLSSLIHGCRPNVKLLADWYSAKPCTVIIGRHEFPCRSFYILEHLCILTATVPHSPTGFKCVIRWVSQYIWGCINYVYIFNGPLRGPEQCNHLWVCFDMLLTLVDVPHFSWAFIIITKVVRDPGMVVIILQFTLKHWCLRTVIWVVVV